MYAYAKCMLLLCLLLSEKEEQSFQTVVAKITAQTILIYLQKRERVKVAKHSEIATEVQQKCWCSPAWRNVSSIFTSWFECFIL